MTNHEFILDLLRDGKRHCSDEIPFRDYRARVGELRRGKNKWHRKFNIQGVECKGQCGRTHHSPVHILWLEESAQVQEFTRPTEQRAVQPEKLRTESPSTLQPTSQLTAKEFFEIYEKERAFLNRPPKQAELRKAIERYKQLANVSRP
jgi:hypothetical protein